MARSLHILNVAVKQKRLAANPLFGNRIPCFREEVNPKAALYVGDRAGENRDRRAHLSAEHYRDRLGARAEVQEETAPHEEGAG